VLVPKQLELVAEEQGRVEHQIPYIEENKATNLLSVKEVMFGHFSLVSYHQTQILGSG